MLFEGRIETTSNKNNFAYLLVSIWASPYSTNGAFLQTRDHSFCHFTCRQISTQIRRGLIVSNASLHSHPQSFSGFVFTKMIQHHRSRKKRRDRVDFSRPYQRRRTTVDRLKDRRVCADVGRRRNTQSADKHTGFVTQDIAE